ncbi:MULTISPECIES: hypothetical protein [unclassified Oceanobacillus]|uniref:hypothetical protein n=1 Tax=unclassified Oceanobacillus TaxID=2630292 RepID=UPI0012EC69AF|nr:hypothetical protein [Oceanobacillus sp. AG]
MKKAGVAGGNLSTPAFLTHFQKKSPSSIGSVELLASYKDIGTVQLNTVLNRLEQEIETLEQSITSLHEQIASTNSSISALKERREELRNQ